jgi:hypothetical protein
MPSNIKYTPIEQLREYFDGRGKGPWELHVDYDTICIMLYGHTQGCSQYAGWSPIGKAHDLGHSSNVGLDLANTLS